MIRIWLLFHSSGAVLSLGMVASREYALLYSSKVAKIGSLIDQQNLNRRAHFSYIPSTGIIDEYIRPQQNFFSVGIQEDRRVTCQFIQL